MFASVCYVAQETACFVRPHQRTPSTNWVKQALRSPFFSPPLTCIFDARHGRLCKPVSVRDGLIRDDRAGTFFRRQRVKPEHALRQRWTSAGGRFFRSFSRCVVLADVGRAIECTSNSSLSSNSHSIVTLQILTLFDPTNIGWMTLSTASCWPDLTRLRTYASSDPVVQHILLFSARFPSWELVRHRGGSCFTPCRRMYFAHLHRRTDPSLEQDTRHGQSGWYGMRRGVFGHCHVLLRHDISSRYN